VAANLTRSESRVLINPTGLLIGAANAIIWGRARQYHVAEFPGPLSIKSVVRGSGIWETAEAERVVDTGSYLVLNAGRPYSITIDAREIVETFCLFFRPGFVEDVNRVESRDPAALLNDPFAAEQQEEKSAIAKGNGRLRVEFFETLHGHDALVSPLLRRIYARVRKGAATQEYLEDQFFAVARAMLRVRRRSEKQAARIPAKKLSTRLELYKRLLRGRDFLDSFHAEDLPLNEVAHAACVSPYHFHRLFREVFGETPNQYLQRKRLQRARELLESSDRGVTEISMHVGFESSTSFSALFRRTFGCSPREYRSLSFRSARDAEKK
jgi:AraC family transcriptional regulator